MSSDSESIGSSNQISHSGWSSAAPSTAASTPRTSLSISDRGHSDLKPLASIISEEQKKQTAQEDRKNRVDASMARQKELAPMNNWVYDLMLWAFSILVDLFFREVHPRGAWKIPRKEPVIFVAAPHANQFVDPLILMRAVRMEAHRRIAFLIAEKSMRRKFIGVFARAVGAVPVSRAMDSTKAGTGKIYLPDPENDPCLVRGVGTKFDGPEVQTGGLLVLPTVAGEALSAEILEVHGPEEIKLKRPFKGASAFKMLTGREEVPSKGDAANGDANNTKVPVDGFEGTRYKTAPKVDQTQVYNAVFDRLNIGGCVGIFPEGGSHDRTELLPLKAGVAIMALGALAANPDCGLKIVPCGMNYFHAHKFRSRAVIEFGTPIEVPDELVELYKQGERREAVRQLLETVYQSLVAVTVTSPDYETLMLIQAVRRLYNPIGKKLPLSKIVELNRRLVQGYSQYKDDPRIAEMRVAVKNYNKQLRLLGLRDHQVEYAKFSVPKVVFTLIYRLGKLATLFVATLPGLVLFAPVFVATKMISIKKSREALAASTVKVQGRDVMATWKLLVALAFAPILYGFYISLFTWWTYRNRMWGTVPEWVPLWAVVVFGNIVFPSITFAALRFGEIGMDIFKSLRPLVLSLNPSSSNTLVRLRQTRQMLSKNVTDVINTLGPEIDPDFESHRLVQNPFIRDDTAPTIQFSPPTRQDSDSFSAADNWSPTSSRHHTRTPSHGLPRNESFGNLGNIALFATRPPSRQRSRSNSTGGGLTSGFLNMKPMSALDSKEGFDEVSKKIRGAMEERSLQRRKTQERDEEGEDSEGEGMVMGKKNV